MEVIEYMGHRIAFDVADRGKGWTWTFQIDSGPVIANTGTPHPNELLARLEAIAVAGREIASAVRRADRSARLGHANRGMPRTAPARRGTAQLQQQQSAEAHALGRSAGLCRTRQLLGVADASTWDARPGVPIDASRALRHSPVHRKAIDSVRDLYDLG